MINCHLNNFFKKFVNQSTTAAKFICVHFSFNVQHPLINDEGIIKLISYKKICLLIFILKSGNTKYNSESLLKARWSWKLSNICERKIERNFHEFFTFLSGYFFFNLLQQWTFFCIGIKWYFSSRTVCSSTIHICWKLFLQLSTSTRCDKNWKILFKKIEFIFGIFQCEIFKKIQNFFWKKW